MSIFRPHKSKPRQFNYIPRFYDPVKEQREQRRRELHGTSATDEDVPYTPGRYIRTQREAREVSREESSGAAMSRMRLLLLAVVLVVVSMMLLLPRVMRFVETANLEKMASQQSTELFDEVEGDVERSIILNEQHADIDFREFETLSPEIINEIEEWQNSVGTITIYDDDVEIRDGRRVEK
ncbi:MAG: hypothetical protein J6R38_00030 [Alistipes sp.]|nr:hypothetical protein [Alistipes sp.]